MAQVITKTVIKYRDQDGSLLDEFDTFISLDASRGVNKPGWCTVEIPAAALKFSNILKHQRIEIRRKVDTLNYYTEFQTHFFIVKWRQDTSADGKEIITLAGPSALCLLDYPIIAYNASTSYTAKSGAADDVMKAIVRENRTTATVASRNIDDWLTIASDTSQGPSIDKAFTRRNVLEVLQEISDLSAQLGDPIYFDVVSTGATFEFRTYPGQRGIDRTTGTDKVIVSPAFGNLTEPFVEIDRSEEVTVAYACGTGEAAARVVQSYASSTRSVETPFNWIEKFVDSKDSGTDTTKLLNEAKSAVYAGRPRVRLGGKITQTADFRYGVEWEWGDKVPISYAGYSTNVMIDNVREGIREGQETITPEYREVD